MDAVDLLFLNIYPFWEGVPLDEAVGVLHGWYEKARAVAGNKPVHISETGWSSCGEAVGAAVPSPENAALYCLNVLSWARTHAVPLFYFSGLDESWKVAREGTRGACWGIRRKDGTLKPGFQAVFDGRVLPDNWGATTPIPGGPGTPAISFTQVPRYNSFDLLHGHIGHVRPVSFKVAVFIYIPPPEGPYAAGWWTKPSWDCRWTAVRPNGRFVCNITTGGVDHRATAIAAYLLPNPYDPPLLGRSPALPDELERNTIAKAIATRSPR
jgi:hypothetical protein